MAYADKIIIVTKCKLREEQLSSRKRKKRKIRVSKRKKRIKRRTKKRKIRDWLH